MRTRRQGNDRELVKRMVQDEFENSGYNSIYSFFERFSAQQVLKMRDLTDEELEEGIVGGKDDGGIDAIYLFLNNRISPPVDELNETDMPSSEIKTIELYLFQCKFTEHVGQDVVDKLVVHMSDWLEIDFTADDPDYTSRFNPTLMEVFKAFHWLYRKSRDGVVIRVHVYIVHLADDVSTIRNRAEKHLSRRIKDLVRHAEVQIVFINPSKLLDLIRTEPHGEEVIKVEEHVSKDGYRIVALVNLQEFYRFLTGGTGAIRDYLFESNVRDFQGLKNKVNLEILDTLRNQDQKVDFWWLNNGITIIADSITPRGKDMYLVNPQIVNGLQTSHSIVTYFLEGNLGSETRHILVRLLILEEDDDEVRNRIIKATNNQTSIQPILLHATERIHKDIADYMKMQASPLYYERRHRYYTRKGIKQHEVIGIKSLAQSMVSFFLWEPHTARARLSAWLRQESHYKKIFNPDYPLSLYYICAYIRKRLELVVRAHDFDENEDDKAWARYITQHTITYLSIVLSNNPTGPEMGEKEWSKFLTRIDIHSITDELILDAVYAVLHVYKNPPFYAHQNQAKSPQLVQAIIDLARSQIRGQQ